jgi:hypothetical protein
MAYPPPPPHLHGHKVNQNMPYLLLLALSTPCPVIQRLSYMLNLIYCKKKNYIFMLQIFEK